MKKSVSSNKQVKKGADTGISIDGYIDYNAFNEARERIIGKAHNDKGIGTLSEKTLHAVLKNYYEPDEDKHEVAIDGYYADIFNDSGIIEIQTRQLNKLRDKLTVFLEEYHVTVVYPCAYNKWREAVEQIHRYAEAPRVEALRQGTKLHLIIMQFEGWELKRMEEV